MPPLDEPRLVKRHFNQEDESVWTLTAIRTRVVRSLAARVSFGDVRIPDNRSINDQLGQQGPADDQTACHIQPDRP
jgi:hypothetical protein